MVYPKNTISNCVKNKWNYVKALEAILDIREIDLALDWKFYITFLFPMKNEDKECKI